MNPVVGNLLGMGVGGVLGHIGNQMQYGQQQELMDLQNKNQMKLNEQGAKIARENWDYTNYENQVKHMDKAGLNRGLMYGQSGGGGGTLSSGSGGNAASGNAPQNVMGMALQGAQIASQTELNKAQAEKLRAETAKTSGVDTEEATQRISGSKSQQAGIELDNALKSGNMETALKTAGQIYENEKAKNITLVNEGKISGSDASVRDKQNSIDMLNKIMNTKQMSEGIKQKWNDLKIAQQNADANSKNADTNYKNYLINERNNKVNEFKAQLEAQYPGVDKVMGGLWNNLIREWDDIWGIDTDKDTKYKKL